MIPVDYFVPTMVYLTGALTGAAISALVFYLVMRTKLAELAGKKEALALLSSTLPHLRAVVPYGSGRRLLDGAIRIAKGEPDA